MSRKEQRYKKNQRINALMEEITTNFTNGTITAEVGSPTYNMLMTHPLNKSRVDKVVTWNCKGFLGYRK